MKKFLIIFLFSFILFSFARIAFAEEICIPDGNTIDDDLNGNGKTDPDEDDRPCNVCEPCLNKDDCQSGLECPGAPEGVCQDPNNVVFCPPIVHKTFGDLIDAIINFIFKIALVIAPLMAIIGAVYILTAGGDPKRVGTGKSIIIYALIGFAIIMLAKGLIAMLESVIGVKIGG